MKSLNQIKKRRMTVGVITLSLFSLTVMSCNSAEKQDATTDETQQNKSEISAENSTKGDASAIVDNYLKLKDALVADNQKDAAKAGGLLVGDFEAFDKSKYSSEEVEELTDIFEDAKENAEHISESPIKHQREHFDLLSKDLIDMIAITGTDKKLYQDYCPMYGDNGAQWLSNSEEIKNPYYGSKMMSCGEVQKEIK